MRRRRSTLELVVGALLGLGLGACQAIAGIEERTFDPEGGQTDRPECQQYCTRVMAACVDEHQVYISEEVCLGLCSFMDLGQAIEPVGNTVACRAHQAGLAEREPEDHCPLAGPGGGGACGTDCEAYCQLFEKTCANDVRYPTQASCIGACEGLTDQATFDVIADHEGDTIECRLVHVSSAAIEPEPHCSHAPMAPGGPWCLGDADAPPTCEEYCNIAQAACKGDLAQYDSEEQCIKVCGALVPGKNSDLKEDTVGCRRYHAFSATLGAEMHCPHAGPSGDGHCGDTGLPASGRTGNCDAYCRILAEACPDELGATFRDESSCRSTCVDFDGAAPESKYSVTKADDPSNTGLQCRLLHAVRAFEDATQCAAAVGGAPCE